MQEGPLLSATQPRSSTMTLAQVTTPSQTRPPHLLTALPCSAGACSCWQACGGDDFAARHLQACTGLLGALAGVQGRANLHGPALSQRFILCRSCSPTR